MVLIDEIASRYIATCHPYEGRLYAELAEEWKRRLANGEREMSEEVFAMAFPHARRIYNSGRVLQDYFESLNEGSHNMLIWLFLANSVRRRLPEEVLKNIARHAEYCSVKVGQVDKVINMPSLTGRYIFDRDILDWSLCSESSEGYYFLHGFDGGKIHVIRKATEQDFQKFRDWFDEKKRIKDIILLQAYKT
jgi:hypothetical protein